MFQPARPLLRWSSEANSRARLYGSEYVVEAVPIRPIRSVTAAIADIQVNGSSRNREAYRMLSASDGPSAKNTASSFAASARCASSW